MCTLYYFTVLQLQVKIRERLFAVKSSTTEEISPINVKDVRRIGNKLDGPSKKKKKLDTDLIKQDAKKNYLSSLKNKLTDEQQEVVDAVNANKNIFFTGK